MSAFDSIAAIREHAAPLEPIPTGMEPKTPRLKDLRAVVFDVYGTLVISGVGDISLAGEAGRADAVLRALRTAGLELNPGDDDDPAEAFHQCIRDQQDRRRRDGIEHPEVEIREVWEAFLDRASARHQLVGEVTTARIEALAVHYEMAVNPVWAMPGLEAVLSSLRARGIPMGIISNAQFFTPLLFPVLIGKSLEDAGVDPRCHVWSYLEREAKPSTALYRKAAAKWKQAYRLEPRQILYVGNDMRNDVWPAQKAGFKTALFAGDQRSLRLREDHPEAGKIQPDWILTHLQQIPDNL